MSDKSGVSSRVLSLPKGGGALAGIGEKFSPDLYTGTGNLSIPITIPTGRNGFQPQLTLSYSAGNGNGFWGLGWGIGIPSIYRKASKGIPRYDDDRDTFLLAGAEDLVPVEQQPGKTRYQPRTEGLFAKIFHYRQGKQNYWEVRDKDGTVNFYGTPAVEGEDPATIADPRERSRVFAWQITRTIDPFGNCIEYRYERDRSIAGRWDQLYPSEIRYGDYGDRQNPRFLIQIKFIYENDRPDAFSGYRSGFAIRTARRCTGIEVWTEGKLARVYRFLYLDRRNNPDYLRTLLPENLLDIAFVPNLAEKLPVNGVSLLSQIWTIGRDGEASEALPPIEFDYSRFEPSGRKFFPVAGADLPRRSLAHPDYELADLSGNGLPDIVEINDTIRYWRNLGEGRFDRPRTMDEAPVGLKLSDSGVQLLDADGDGRVDLLVSGEGIAGYFSLHYGGRWDRRSFQPYAVAPGFNLEDPEVKLLDLTGDGVTDALRSGTTFECFFQDSKTGWRETRRVSRKSLSGFPNVNFSDPRVKLGDMSGDGLQDILLVSDGAIQYWPNLGYGNWGDRLEMKNSPRYRYGYDPRRILVGDVDGDGLADIVYVDDRKVILWINRSGNGWSEPIEIKGTPPVTDADGVRLVDLLGTGVAGVLWSRDTDGRGDRGMFFLDFTGGVKPYLLREMDNHRGAVTRIDYRSSIGDYLEDEKQPATRWRASLPFPVQVVARVDILDRLSNGKLVTEYRYHHGYWDGAEREFRGFARVDQRDTEEFGRFNQNSAAPIAPEQFSPPLETRTWFHQGAVFQESGEWRALDLRHEYWSGDPNAFAPDRFADAFPSRLSRSARRDALRTLKGSILRTEVYALDGKPESDRPYTVSESLTGAREVYPLDPARDDLPPIFFPAPLASRTTQWERGDDPMTQCEFTGEYDEYGQLLARISVAVPRGRDYRVRVERAEEPYLVTYSETTYARRDDASRFLVDRVAKNTEYEIINDGTADALGLREQILAGLAPRTLIDQTLNFYDRDPSRPDAGAFRGLPFGQVGDYGALVRTESLVLTAEIAGRAYQQDGSNLFPPYLRAREFPAGTNLALVSNGARATASSTYDGENPPGAAIDGNRLGSVWPPAWADNTPGEYPDWLEVAFAGTKTIDEIDLFCLQDAKGDGQIPVEPTPDLAFTKYGLVDFEIQTWNGKRWVTVPGGNVTGNHKIWRKFTFPPISTDRIRVLCHKAASAYSRVVEVEAHEKDTGRNVALAANGGKATASSIVQPFPPNRAIDGDFNGSWIGRTPFSFPGWLIVDLPGLQAIDRVDVFSVPDRPGSVVDENLTFDYYGLTDFEVQYLGEDDWITVPGGNITGNNKVWRKITFPATITSKVRLLIRRTADGQVRVPTLAVYSAGGDRFLSDYPADFLSSLSGSTDSTRSPLIPLPLGYGYSIGDAPFAAGYFVATTRSRYDFHESPDGRGRGLVKTTRDPLGRDTNIAYDAYELLPIAVTDPAGLTARATYDYRLLEIVESTDSNGNRTAFTFTPSGLLKETWLTGNPAKIEGDRHRASSSLTYDFFAFAREGRPISVRSVRYLHHDTETDVPLPRRDETIESREYSDGFGRLLQTRVQGETIRFGDAVFGGGKEILPAEPGDGAGTALVGRENSDPENSNVIVSGWQIYDNKGLVVRKYEPFFSTGWDYASLEDFQYGREVTMFYDPRGQVVRTVNPDGSEQRVISGIPRDLENPDRYLPTPWETYTYDSNDNAGRTHADRSRSYRHHWNTPASSRLDALGRTVESIERHRDSIDSPIVDYRTRSTYDIRGNLLTVTDPLDRLAFRYTYDLADRALKIEQMDGGYHCTVWDAAGKAIEQRDSKGSLDLQQFDRLGRPVRLWARDNAGEEITLRERVLYGDSPESGLTPLEASDANLLGQPYRHYDEAGKLTFTAYTFRGKPREKGRQVIRDSQLAGVFAGAGDNGWKVQPYRVNWHPPEGITLETHEASLLEEKVYETSIEYDALDRLKRLYYPRTVRGDRPELLPRYNRAGALTGVTLDGSVYIHRIDYNAKGQRTFIAYGNGTMTRYAHDPLTLRLVRARSERYSQPDPLTYRPTGAPLQDFAYGYDLAGNLLELRERVPDCGVIGTLEGKDALDRRFTYDSLYRLLSATGRECDRPPDRPPWDDRPRCADITRARPYTERYEYDRAGNLGRMQHLHHAGDGSVTGRERRFTMVPGGNRLRSIAVTHPAVENLTYQYAYDPGGNLIQENLTRFFEWDHANRLKAFRVQTDNAEPSIHAHYLYDGTGQRVKKFLRKQGGEWEITVYIDGILEYQRIVSPSPSGGKDDPVLLSAGSVSPVQGDPGETPPIYSPFPDDRATVRENNTLHVLDENARIATVRVGEAFPDDNSPAVQYHLSDHLGSSHLVLDRAGDWVNREEYTPYGETGFGGFSRKRYRYTGKERDEESGFNYHGARYYAPWLGRWVARDPLGLKTGTNAYRAFLNSPLNYVDPTGTSESSNTLGQVGEAMQKDFSDAVNDLRQAFRKRKIFYRYQETHVGPDGEIARSDQIAGRKGKPGRLANDFKARHINNKLVEVGENAGKLDRGKIVSDVRQQLDSAERRVGISGAKKENQVFTLFGEQAGEFKDEYKAIVKETLEKWRNEAVGNPELRRRVNAVVTTAEDYTRATKAVARRAAEAAGSSGVTQFLKSGAAKTASGLAAAGGVLTSGSALAATKSVVIKATTVVAPVTAKAMKMVPMVGIGANLASATNEFRQGNYISGSLDLVGCVPVIGDVVDAGRLGVEVGTAIGNAIDSKFQAGSGALGDWYRVNVLNRF
ncbi:SpvB/TcaC N-terminal domain-containing protein [Pannus brasiliensis CCIBt3594]|uniref:SpvB/TcaC N-terminal domain-containing protein n=1 Tax=Pannus brasiliensis CCIBt3594 TaxID=1427578 RepID=A0AAW9QX73_9CHRO